MKKKIIITLYITIAMLVLSLLIPNSTKAAKNASFYSEDITWEWNYYEEGETMAYGFFTPSTAKDLEFLPMIVYLHGSGQTAVSESSLRSAGLPGALEKWNLENFSAYVLCPHLCEWDGSWTTSNSANNVKKLINKFIEEHNVDEENIVVCGESRGGTGALGLAYQLPDYFSKCVAFSAFYSGPFNTSIDTICYCSYTADDARKYANSWRTAFGEENVFEVGGGHGSVGYSASTDDSGKRVRNCTEIKNLI